MGIYFIGADSAGTTHENQMAAAMNNTHIVRNPEMKWEVRLGD